MAIFHPSAAGSSVLGMISGVVWNVDSGLGPELLSVDGWRSSAGLVAGAGGEMNGLGGWPRNDKHRPGLFTEAALERAMATC